MKKWMLVVMMSFVSLYSAQQEHLIQGPTETLKFVRMCSRAEAQVTGISEIVRFQPDIHQKDDTVYIFNFNNQQYALSEALIKIYNNEYYINIHDLNKHVSGNSREWREPLRKNNQEFINLINQYCDLDSEYKKKCDTAISLSDKRISQSSIEYVGQTTLQEVKTRWGGKQFIYILEKKAQIDENTLSVYVFNIYDGKDTHTYVLHSHFVTVNPDQRVEINKKVFSAIVPAHYRGGDQNQFRKLKEFVKNYYSYTGVRTPVQVPAVFFRQPDTSGNSVAQAPNDLAEGWSLISQSLSGDGSRFTFTIDDTIPVDDSISPAIQSASASQPSFTTQVQRSSSLKYRCWINPHKAQVMGAQLVFLENDNGKKYLFETEDKKVKFAVSEHYCKQLTPVLYEIDFEKISQALGLATAQGWPEKRKTDLQHLYNFMQHEQRQVTSQLASEPRNSTHFAQVLQPITQVVENSDDDEDDEEDPFGWSDATSSEEVIPFCTGDAYDAYGDGLEGTYDSFQSAQEFTSDLESLFHYGLGPTELALDKREHTNESVVNNASLHEATLPDEIASQPMVEDNTPMDTEEDPVIIENVTSSASPIDENTDENFFSEPPVQVIQQHDISAQDTLQIVEDEKQQAEENVDMTQSYCNDASVNEEFTNIKMTTCHSPTINYDDHYSPEGPSPVASIADVLLPLSDNCEVVHQEQNTEQTASQIVSQVETQQTEEKTAQPLLPLPLDLPDLKLDYRHLKGKNSIVPNYKYVECPLCQQEHGEAISLLYDPKDETFKAFKTHYDKYHKADRHKSYTTLSQTPENNPITLEKYLEKQEALIVKNKTNDFKATTLCCLCIAPHAKKIPLLEYIINDEDCKDPILEELKIKDRSSNFEKELIQHYQEYHSTATLNQYQEQWLKDVILLLKKSYPMIDPKKDEETIYELFSHDNFFGFEEKDCVVTPSVQLTATQEQPDIIFDPLLRKKASEDFERNKQKYSDSITQRHGMWFLTCQHEGCESTLTSNQDPSTLLKDYKKHILSIHHKSLFTCSCPMKVTLFFLSDLIKRHYSIKHKPEIFVDQPLTALRSSALLRYYTDQIEDYKKISGGHITCGVKGCKYSLKRNSHNKYEQRAYAQHFLDMHCEPAVYKCSHEECSFQTNNEKEINAHIKQFDHCFSEVWITPPADMQGIQTVNDFICKKSPPSLVCNASDIPYYIYKTIEDERKRSSTLKSIVSDSKKSKIEKKAPQTATKDTINLSMLALLASTQETLEIPEQEEQETENQENQNGLDILAIVSAANALTSFKGNN